MILSQVLGRADERIEVSRHLWIRSLNTTLVDIFHCEQPWHVLVLVVLLVKNTPPELVLPLLALGRAIDYRMDQVRIALLVVDLALIECFVAVRDLTNRLRVGLVALAGVPFLFLLEELGVQGGAPVLRRAGFHAFGIVAALDFVFSSDDATLVQAAGLVDLDHVVLQLLDEVLRAVVRFSHEACVLDCEVVLALFRPGGMAAQRVGHA